MVSCLEEIYHQDGQSEADDSEDRRKYLLHGALLAAAAKAGASKGLVARSYKMALSLEKTIPQMRNEGIQQMVHKNKYKIIFI